MKQLLATFLTTGSILFSTAYAHAAVSNSTAAELACHRIERLILLKKANPGFQNLIQSVSVEALPPAGPGKPAFKTTTIQQADPGKRGPELEIILDEKGRALTANEFPGTAAQAPFKWPKLDPLTLLEKALHYIEDNSKKTEVTPFSAKLRSISIKPGSVNGTAVAKVEVTSFDSPQKLVLTVSADEGKVLKSSVEN